ncbi:MAG: hypothetical protein ACTSV5_12795 [Promethearchaeota archaeon]
MMKKSHFLLLFLCILAINYFLLGYNSHLAYTKFETKSEDTPNLLGLGDTYDDDVLIANISEDPIEFSRAEEEDKIPGIRSSHNSIYFYIHYIFDILVF